MSNTANTVDGGHVRNIAVAGGVLDNSDLDRTLKERFNFDYRNEAKFVDFDNYLRILEYVRAVTYPFKSDEAGYEKLGFDVIKIHYTKTVGKMNEVVAKMIPPHESIHVFGRAMKSGFLNLEHEVLEAYPGYYRYRQFGLAIPPAFVRGMLLAVLDTNRVKNYRIKSTTLQPDNAIYEATWEQ